MIWGVAAEDRVVGDEEANVEDGREEMKKVTSGDENTHGGNAAISGAIWGRKTGWATPSASNAPALRYCLKLGDMNEQEALDHLQPASSCAQDTTFRAW